MQLPKEHPPILIDRRTSPRWRDKRLITVMTRRVECPGMTGDLSITGMRLGLLRVPGNIGERAEVCVAFDQELLTVQCEVVYVCERPWGAMMGVRYARGQGSFQRFVTSRYDHKELDKRIQEEVIEDETGSLGPDPEKTPCGGVELPKGRQLYTEAKDFVQGQFDPAQQGKRVDAEETRVTAEDLLDSIFHNGDALPSLSRLKSCDEYPYHRHFESKKRPSPIQISRPYLDGLLHEAIVSIQSPAK